MPTMLTAPVPAALLASADLTGQSALFVGGSSGVGEASAALALALGAHVTIAGRDDERLSRARVALGDQVAVRQVDATRPDDLDDVLDDLAPDHVILSTSGPYYAALADINAEDALGYLRERFAPSLAVATWAARHPGALRTLTIVGGGLLRKPVAGLSSWGIVGPGLVGLVESLAVELAPTRVNEVAPGMIVDSPLSARYFADDAESEARRAEIERTAPARRPIELADVARQVLGLVLDPALTGTVRTVDAGQGLT